MQERRRNFRGRVYYAGHVVFNDRRSTVSCIVRNFSPTGAKIEFANSAMIPDEVDVTIERKGVAFLARVAWRRKDEAGLAFRNSRPMKTVIPLDEALRLRVHERANKTLRARLEQLRTGY